MVPPLGQKIVDAKLWQRSASQDAEEVKETNHQSYLGNFLPARYHQLKTEHSIPELVGDIWRSERSKPRLSLALEQLLTLCLLLNVLSMHLPYLSLCFTVGMPLACCDIECTSWMKYYIRRMSCRLSEIQILSTCFAVWFSPSVVIVTPWQLVKSLWGRRHCKIIKMQFFIIFHFLYVAFLGDSCWNYSVYYWHEFTLFFPLAHDYRFIISSELGSQTAPCLIGLSCVQHFFLNGPVLVFTLIRRLIVGLWRPALGVSHPPRVAVVLHQEEIKMETLGTSALGILFVGSLREQS